MPKFVILEYSDFCVPPTPPNNKYYKEIFEGD